MPLCLRGDALILTCNPKLAATQQATARARSKPKPKSEQKIFVTNNATASLYPSSLTQVTPHLRQPSWFYCAVLYNTYHTSILKSTYNTRPTAILPSSTQNARNIRFSQILARTHSETNHKNVALGVRAQATLYCSTHKPKQTAICSG